MNIMEICKRASNGVQMSSEAFDLDKVYTFARNVCEKYHIVYDSQTPVPFDDDLADRVYQAAIDFLAQTGVYCPNTHRVIKFDREEILHVVAHSRGRCIMGEGKDRFTWAARQPDSDIPPWYHVGTGIVNTDERIARNLVKSYAGIELANSISAPALETVDGQMIASGTPTEVLGAIRGIKIAREALREAGRPGLAIGNCISTAGTSLATIAASAPQFGLRPSDGWLVGAMAELKYDMATLCKAVYLSSWGANIGNESGPLVGGYAGGPAETAVLNVAYRMAGILVLQCDYHLTFPIHITKSCSTSREVLWCVAVSSQAISRNTKELVWSLGYIAAGPMTKQFFYETAAYMAAVIPSGVSAQTTHPARAILNDYVTPMEIRGSVELTEASVGMTREEGNELAKKLLTTYEKNLDNAPKGKTYQECYDINTGQPNAEYIDLYGEVKEELKNMGFQYKR